MIKKRVDKRFMKTTIKRVGNDAGVFEVEQSVMKPSNYVRCRTTGKTL